MTVNVFGSPPASALRSSGRDPNPPQPRPPAELGRGQRGRCGPGGVPVAAESPVPPPHRTSDWPGVRHPAGLGRRRVRGQARAADGQQTCVGLDRGLRRLVHLLSGSPGRLYPAWGITVGFWVQVVGLLLWAWSFSKLARSYGIVPADRGLVTGGAYAIVRHPLYSAYVVGGIGYLMQSLSVRNAVVEMIAVSWQLVRIRAEERHLESPAYAAYRARVPWRLCPGLW
jgi:protein-S-isoprenylcysteine O-methyltransferase Ste14